MNRVTTTTTFLVSNVAPATTLLEEVPYKEAVETLLKMTARNRRIRPLEACARYHGHLIAGVPFQPAVAAAHRALMDHRPVCLSPDIIWLTICQGCPWLRDVLNEGSRHVAMPQVPIQGR
jgi:hypothetical protein